jgi:CDP-diacylglycerol---glycerol-3-phosphate 3-phosphatidyltransferase
MNLANGITIARISLIPVFVVLLFSNVPYGAYMAAAVFAVAALTDKLDGYVARRRKTITSLGIFLDPLADKMLVAAALISLVSLGQLAAWVATVIIGREFAVTGLRLYAVTQGVDIPADSLGKAKTVSQIVAILFLMVPRSTFPYDTVVEWGLVGLAVVLTVASGIQYFWNARDLLTGHGGGQQPAGEEKGTSEAGRPDATGVADGLAEGDRPVGAGAEAADGPRANPGRDAP